MSSCTFNIKKLICWINETFVFKWNLCLPIEPTSVRTNSFHSPLGNSPHNCTVVNVHRLKPSGLRSRERCFNLKEKNLTLKYLGKRWRDEKELFLLVIFASLFPLVKLETFLVFREHLYARLQLLRLVQCSLLHWLIPCKRLWKEQLRDNS